MKNTITYLPVIFLFMLLSVDIYGQSVTKSPLNVKEDSTVFNITKEINADSIASYISKLQSYGSRFLYYNNRHEIAEWIKNKFISFGIQDVKVDSFLCVYKGTPSDTLLQKNVVATIRGEKYPDNVIVIGGHYDSYCSSFIGAPPVSAPGADDDASGTAGTMEIARAIAAQKYKPASTIKFVAFGAEEYMINNDSGSKYYAETAAKNKTNISMMINLDMIGNSPRDLKNSQVNLNYYQGYEYLLQPAIQNTKKYSVLNPIAGTKNQWSDSYPFYQYDFPAIYFEEFDFSPYYHSVNDLLKNINVPYCAEIAKAACGLLLNEQRIILRKIQKLSAQNVGDGKSAILKWESGTSTLLKEFRICWSADSLPTDSMFVKGKSALIAGLKDGAKYLFRVSSVSIDNNTSMEQTISFSPAFFPAPISNLKDIPLKKEIKFFWSPNIDLDFAGYYVYRSESRNGPFNKLNKTLLIDTSFSDNTPSAGKYYYYMVTAVDSAGNESRDNKIIRSRCISLDKGILVVDYTINEDGSISHATDKEVDDFYSDILKGYSFSTIDAIEEGEIKLADLGAYSTVIIHNDNYASNYTAYSFNEMISKYLEFGGNLIYSGYKPGLLFGGSDTGMIIFPTNSFIYNSLKIKRASLLSNTKFCGTLTARNGYQVLRVDSSKTLAGALYNYHLLLIESISAAEGGTEIFTYNTNYDTALAPGKMKGMPVGIEYSGSDHKSVIISFPLYFMQKEDARKFISVALSKFGFLTKVEDKDNSLLPLEYSVEQNYPNPFNPVTTIGFHLPKSSYVTLKIYDILGREIKLLVNGYMKAGRYTVDFDASSLSSGTYIYKLSADGFSASRKMVLIK